MTTLLSQKPKGKLKSAGKEFNVHGEPTQKLITFCGQKILDELEQKLKSSAKNSTKIYFQGEDGRCYHVYKDKKNNYNVYEYTEEMTERKSQACPEKNNKSVNKEEKRTSNPWVASERALNYEMPNNHFDDLGQLGRLVDYSYFENEKPIIDEYNKNVDEEHRIYLCAFSDFGLYGNIDNAIFLCCLLNSGFDDNKPGQSSDIDAYEDAKIRKLIDKIRSGKIKANIGMTKEAFAIKRNGQNYPFVTWVRGKCNGKDHKNQEWLLDFIKKESKLDDDTEAFDWGAKYCAIRDFYYYHSHKANNACWKRACRKITGRELAFHQQYVIEEVNKAMEKNIPIILFRTRGDWIRYLPKLKEYPLLFCGTARGAVSFSSNNIVHFSDKNRKLSESDLAIAKKRAWEDFKQAMIARLNVINGEVK